MRSGIARQNSDVHPDTFAGKAKKPFHRRAGKVRSARRGIAARTDPGAYYAAGTVHDVVTSLFGSAVVASVLALLADLAARPPA